MEFAGGEIASEPGRYRFPFIELQFARSFLNQRCGNRTLLLNVCVYQRIFTQQIDDSRYAARVAVDSLDGFGRKHRITSGSCSVQAVLNITGSFVQAQWRVLHRRAMRCCSCRRSGRFNLISSSG